MPKISYIAAAAPKRDRLKEAIEGRRRVQHMTLAELGQKCGISETAMCRLMSKPSSDWKVGMALNVCKALDIPIAEVRELIG